MSTLEHVIVQTPVDWQYVVMSSSTFPPNSLAFGSDARINDEIVYEVKADKTGGGFGYVLVDSLGVPNVRGEDGEYTFSWFMRDATDSGKSAIYTCVVNAAGFGDSTAPTVILANQTVSDNTPALSGTVNDATARVVVTFNGADYPAINNGAGGWILADNVVAALSAGANTVTITACDGAGNAASDTATITYEGSDYTFIHDFDVAAGTYTNGADVTTIASTVGAGTLTSGAGFYPSYESLSDSLVFSKVPADRMYNAALASFSEAFLVLTDIEAANYAYLLRLADTVNAIDLRTYPGGKWWLNSSIQVPGRTVGNKYVIAIRCESGIATMSVDGGAEYTYVNASVPTAFTKAYIHNGNFDGSDMKLHQLALAGALTPTQRTKVIADLKTKWGIA